MTDASSLSKTDLQQLERRGIDVGEIERQVALIERPPTGLSIIRPCSIGDGVTQLQDRDCVRLEDAWPSLSADKDILKFVPASGAATRMFAFLRQALSEFSGPPARAISPTTLKHDLTREAIEILERFHELPMYQDMTQAASERGLDLDRLRAKKPLECLALFLEPEPNRSALSDQPKGLVPFHHYTAGSRTAFEEQLFEAAGYAGSITGAVSVHLTVSPDHLEAFKKALEEIRPRVESQTGKVYEVTFSLQDPATDTVALTQDGSLLRTAGGELVFRPAGHGSLLRNLIGTRADVICIKNIDNIARRSRHELTGAWKRRLIGLLLGLREEIGDLIGDLETGGTEAITRTIDFCNSRLTLRIPEEIHAMSPNEQREVMLGRLDRPLRVCGVVPNAGEPGGGPFWVGDASGIESGQIVEGSQIDPAAAAQFEIFSSATHFNPVDVVCSILDRNGDPYPLADYVDEATSFVAGKTHEGQGIRALERPGLWNGAMGRWNTTFVEVPIETFTPVKTLLDLLRPEHLQG